MDDATAAKLFRLLRSQQVLISELHLDVQALVDCLSQLPDFEHSLQKRKAEIRDSPEYQKVFRGTLDSIDTIVQALKKSNGGA